jgi:tRNA G18 (ribose-2'-O)-methylase SpoU
MRAPCWERLVARLAIMGKAAQMSGYFGVGIFHSKTAVNVGTLFRSAYVLGASYVFTIGRRYTRQASDVGHATMHMPLFHYHNFEDFYGAMPKGSVLVGIELVTTAQCIRRFSHPKRACYLLGAEDHGLPPAIMARCHTLVKLPGTHSLNVATAGSLVMYDRWAKTGMERAWDATSIYAS